MSFSIFNPPFAKKSLRDGFFKCIREDCMINWKIFNKDFDISKKQIGKILFSDLFPKEDHANFKWKLNFYPFGQEEEEVTDYIAIYLHLYIITDIPISATYHFCIKDEKNSIIGDKHGKYIFKRPIGYGCPDFAETSKLNGEFITICAEVSAEYYTESLNCIQNLFHDYFNLLKDGIFSDLTLCTEQDKTEFKVHRNILASRSKVFHAMLTAEMEEKITGRIVIKDFSSSVMKSLLNFIYNSEVEFQNMEETFSLLVAADKYELLDLKLYCVEYLRSILDLKNACYMLLKSDIYNLSEFKQTIFEYIHENKIHFSDPSKYQILKKDPDLLVEFIIKIFERN